ncbi:uncharacterized protein LOC121835449, partial [Ixodes scapularis]|uniref:uncharacterized protein LOC121835449 n=1 Tax=Ixodes scapularis TaxID=6945 RepID=UPI001C388F3B
MHETENQTPGPTPIVRVRSGAQATLLCPLGHAAGSGGEGTSSPVLALRWSRVDGPSPRQIYAVDGRGRGGDVWQAEHVVDADWATRSYFSIHNDPALLKIGRVTLVDSGTYVCTVAYRDGREANTTTVHLSVMKLTFIIHLMRFISGTTWGATVGCLQRLFEAFFLGLLRYHLPILNNTCASNIRAIQCIEAQALRACLGLPRCASTSGTIAEARRYPIEAYMIQETIRLHLRHLTRHPNHHLATLPSERPESAFSKTITKHNIVPSDLFPVQKDEIPPWTFLKPRITLYVKGIHKKTSIPSPVLKQLTLGVINEAYGLSTHIYTDESSSETLSGIGVVIPAHNHTVKMKIRHRTTSTASELAAIREAIRYIMSRSPQPWTIFSDSKSALQIIQTFMKRNAYDQLAYQVSALCHQALVKGHQISTQWIPGHCGIPGNNAADRAAKSTISADSILIPYSKSDSNAKVQALAKTISLGHWMNVITHDRRLYFLDPQRTFRVPSGISRRLETTLHRLRLGVA